MPDQVCGVKVDSGVLSPLLPKGKQLGQSRQDKGPGSVSCRVTVDDSLVLYLAQDLTDPGTDAMESRGLQRMGDPADVEGVGDRAAVADRGAKAVVECTHEGRPRLFVGLVQLERAEPVPADTRERRDAVLAFLKSWFPAAVSGLGCVS
ncbi:hypothetical protein [Saccharothrix variisporea]|uniref:hypothetical protein n=1 Tax=Saccharothrix variisporea TaxID=543527 RepID=UPI0011C34343|nr:hypothetical protein [Saccharothrix variisporea]